MNELLMQIKTNLALAMKIEVGIRKGLDEEGKLILKSAGGEEKVYAQKEVSRAIISMIPQLGKKSNEATEEDIQKLLKKYISIEKERAIYQLGYLKEADVEGKTAQEVKKLVENTIYEIGDALTNHKIEIAQSYLPKQASEEEILEFIKTIDMSKFKNKMQAMGLIMKQFKGLDGNIAKRLLMSYEQ